VLYKNRQIPAQRRAGGNAMQKESARSKRNLIMVLGASHSGTTMLDLMLGNHDETFSTGEVWAHFRPCLVHHFSLECRCGEIPCPVWKNFEGVNETGFHKTVLELANINSIVDSSKDLSWAIDSAKWAQTNDIRVRNVVIWKEPIELAFSHWKRGRSVATFRHDFLTYYERFLNLGFPFVSVRFSSLVGDPTNSIRKLCEITGLPWHEQQEEFWSKEHHHLFGAAKTGAQTKTGRSTIKAAQDYPDEFLQLFEEFAKKMTNDQRLMRVIGALESMDFEKSYVPGILEQEARIPSIKPLWYYRHIIKRIFFRRFPRVFIPTTADIPEQQT
jgi:hypothetical protein